MTIAALAPMDLAALLCSRVCHDVISPVGAIVNGLEVLEDEKDPQMREVAIELIKKSAASASARLQFCRLAFGAAGSVGAAVDTGDAEAALFLIRSTATSRICGSFSSSRTSRPLTIAPTGPITSWQTREQSRAARSIGARATIVMGLFLWS